MDLPKPPDPQLDPVGYLRSIGSVRERSKIVTEKAVKNQLNHFDVDMRKFPDVVAFVSNIIKVRITAELLSECLACVSVPDSVWTRSRSEMERDAHACGRRSPWKRAKD
jgi:hypothetical protein